MPNDIQNLERTADTHRAHAASALSSLVDRYAPKKVGQSAVAEGADLADQSTTICVSNSVTSYARSPAPAGVSRGGIPGDGGGGDRGRANARGRASARGIRSRARR